MAVASELESYGQKALTSAIVATAVTTKPVPNNVPLVQGGFSRTSRQYGFKDLSSSWKREYESSIIWVMEDKLFSMVPPWTEKDSGLG